MLTELRLSGFGVVDEAVLELGPGLTALTGETGAGKTMIVAGLGLLLGGRGDAGVVRHGRDRATVQGRWQVPPDVVEQVAELGGDVDDGDDLVTLRHISAQGRSRAMVGGTGAPISSLASILSELATIHGQQEQIRLASLDRQREILDEYAKPSGLVGYRADWAERRAAVADLEELVAQEAARVREIDLLRFGVGEIDAIAPEEGEDEALAAESVRLHDSDELKRLAMLVSAALSGDEDDFDAPSALALAGEARKSLAALADRDPLAKDLADRLLEVHLQLGDLAADVAGYAADLTADPLRLEAVTTRRAELAGLTRKYGETVAEVRAWADDARTRLATLEGSDERIELLRGRVAELDNRLVRAAESISEQRRDAAHTLAVAVREELAALAMPHARLEFEVTPVELGPHGADKVELMLAANPGSPSAPLSKVASGGELSRIRLALEVVLAGHSPHHTFVFDEVDAGVSGAVGLEIGRRLQRLADTSQVIVVTHLAQVAAFADAHFVVSKSIDGHVTTSDVRRLAPGEREPELARMMGGSATSEAGVGHAAELLAQATHR